MKNLYPTKTNKSTVLVRDEVRYAIVDRAIKKLCDIFAHDGYCSVSVRPNEESETSLTAEFVTDCINITIEALSHTVALAETISISPRTDGYMNLKLLFDGLYTPAMRIC